MFQENIPACDHCNQHLRYGARAATGVAGNLIERPVPHAHFRHISPCLAVVSRIIEAN